jgi:hypothetical protein
MIQTLRRISLALACLACIQFISYMTIWRSGIHWSSLFIKSNITYNIQSILDPMARVYTHVHRQDSNETMPLDWHVDRSLFINASFVLNINFTSSYSMNVQMRARCTLPRWNKSSSRIALTNDSYLLSYSTMEKIHANGLYPGGHWFPLFCRATQRLALIVCYRHRLLQLKFFLNHMHRFLKQQKVDYTIFVVNQHGQEQFNRAALFNVGFLEARKVHAFDCFIFHDVDLLPEDLRNIYQCGQQPRHM